nr:hypothetical protein [Acinetobacter sp. Marseille-Q1620]
MNHKLITYLKTNLDVSREDITDSLMMAPIYTASIAYPLVCLSIIIGENFTVESFESIITAPIFFIIVLLIYFVFVYVFAYISQTFLLRKKASISLQSWQVLFLLLFCIQAYYPGMYQLQAQ